MKKMLKTLSLTLIICVVISACKKENKTSSTSSPMAGFWTFKSDPNNSNNYWNDNALFGEPWL
jgi:hypothetical protein